MANIDRAIARQRRRLQDREDAAVARLQRAHLDILGTLQSDLDAITRRIERAIRDGEPINIDWLRRQERYHRLIEDTRLAYASYEPLVGDVVVNGKRDAIQSSRADAVERAEALGLRGTTMYASLNTPALEALTGQLAPDSPLMGVITSHGDNAVDIIERELVRGMGRGSGADEMVRAIRRQLGGDADASRIRALVRTEMHRSYRSSLFFQYQEMGFTHWRWSAALSSRTCLACLSRHGTLYPMTEAYMPAHVNCRCSPQPASASSRHRGMTGEDWFMAQPSYVQRSMIGSQDAFEAFERGDLRLRDFEGMVHSETWGDSIIQLSGRSALRKAGVA